MSTTPTPELAAPRPPGSSHLTLTLSALTSAGGVYGYVKSGSSRSAIAGLLLGGAFFYSAQLIATPGATERGFRLATGASAVLAGAMAMRLAKTRALMPAGLLTAVGAASAAYHGAKWREWADE
jgi:uncharacterized membrane protein (UPF0136 family)